MSSHKHLSDKKINSLTNEIPDIEQLEKLSDFFKVFGDLTRLRILVILLNKELCVHDISKALKMSQSAISHQLKTLRQATLVKFRRKGKSILYSLDDDHIEQIYKMGLEHINELK